MKNNDVNPGKKKSINNLKKFKFFKKIDHSKHVILMRENNS